MKFVSCALVAFAILATPAFAISTSTIAKHHKKHKPAHGAPHKAKQKPSASSNTPSTDTTISSQSPRVTA